ncbi:MAG: hypothetical protein M3198_06335 [Actinomycetota bacterium]|nr:hypothetical protein [Actinomycetota bacterium]
MRGKPILALAFVAIIGVALSFPLRDPGRSGDSRRLSAEATPTSAPQTPDETPPSPEPSETKSPEKDPPEDEPADTDRLTGTYPKKCLSPASPPEGSGLLAVNQGNGIEISDINGDPTATIEDRFPFKWSPSGRYLMGRSGRVYDSGGDETARLFDSGSVSWAWSPIADCIVFASLEGGVSTFTPGSGSVKLHNGLMSRFSFSPSGGDLAYVEDDPDDQKAHLWVASLASGRARRLTTLDLASGEEVVLAGWTPDASHVLFWRGAPDALLRTGGSLFAASADNEVKRLARVVAHRDFIASCGEELLAVTGGGSRLKANSKRLAVLEAGQSARYLTPAEAHDISPSCSPDSTHVAVARSPQADGRGPASLTVLDLSGNVVFASEQTEATDAYPMWGRGDAGLLFIRQAPGEGVPELWQISQTTPAQPTGLSFEGIRRDPGIFRDSWAHFLDWSADQPTGLSALSEEEES